MLVCLLSGVTLSTSHVVPARRVMLPWKEESRHECLHDKKKSHGLAAAGSLSCDRGDLPKTLSPVLRRSSELETAPASIVTYHDLTLQ
jgi:hypothetical protein